MSPDAPVYRGNWAVFNDLEGPLDLYTPEGHEERNSAMSGVRPYEGEKTGRVLTFRCEYQTLRKLEKSKAIIFSIRTYQMYLENFKTLPRDDAEVLVRVIENIHPDFIAYKAARFWKDAALKYLRRNVLEERETEENHGIWSSLKTGSALVVGASVLAMAVAWMNRD